MQKLTLQFELTCMTAPHRIERVLSTYASALLSTLQLVQLGGHNGHQIRISPTDTMEAQSQIELLL